MVHLKKVKSPYSYNVDPVAYKKTLKLSILGSGGIFVGNLIVMLVSVSTATGMFLKQILWGSVLALLILVGLQYRQDTKNGKDNGKIIPLYKPRP